MKRTLPCALVLVLFAVVTAHGVERASAQGYPAMAPIGQYLMASTADEIVLARSAAPASISSKATVFVLGRHGYYVAAKGTNGFVCLVERSWGSPFNNVEFWNPKVLGPECFNPPAAQTEVPQYLKRTEWVVAGSTERQLMDRTRAAIVEHSFKPPLVDAFSYMMSKGGHLGGPGNGPWFPHIMFFLERGQDANWGANEPGVPVLTEDRELESTHLFVLVRTWSDGSPAPQPRTEQHSG